MKPQKQCNNALCRRLIDYTEQYCVNHKPKYQRPQESYSERMEKDGQYRKFYKSKAWRDMSYIYRLNNPVCEQCIELGIAAKADVVDHIIEIKDDWSRRLDDSNLKSLCHQHHEIKTRRERDKRKG